MKKTHCIMFSLCWLDTDTVIVDYTQLPDVSIWTKTEFLKRNWGNILNISEMLEKFFMEFLFSSPEPKCQVSFSDHMSVLTLIIILFTVSQQTYICQSILVWRTVMYVQLKVKVPFQDVKYIGNSENKEGSLRNLNLF